MSNHTPEMGTYLQGVGDEVVAAIAVVLAVVLATIFILYKSVILVNRKLSNFRITDNLCRLSTVYL